MNSKDKAPKGKGRKSTKKPKTIGKVRKTPLATSKQKKPVITLEAAIQFIQSQGIQLTEKSVEELASLAVIQTEYQGKPEDNSRRLKILMLQALEKSFGLVITACNLCGVSRATHYRWMTEDEEYSECVKNLGEVALDFVESKLIENIQGGKEASAIFYLKTKGKKRGYIETVHNVNQNFDDSNVHYYLPDNGRGDGIEEAKVVSE